MRTYKPSILIEDSDGRLIAAVEAQSRLDMPKDLATYVRSFMLDYGGLTTYPVHNGAFSG